MGWISSLINLGKSEFLDKPYQKSFWYEQQEYNSPKNQVQRLKDGGLNPQLMLGNIQTASAGSVPQPPNANVASGVTDSILSLINNKKQQNILDADACQKNSDAVLREIDAFTRFTKNLQDIKESMSREGKNKMDEFMTGIIGTAEEHLKRAQTANAVSQNEINWLNYAKGLKELQFLPTRQRIEYVERISGIANMEANTEESKLRKKKLIQETNHEFFKVKGQKFVNSLNEKTEKFLIRERRLKGVPKNPFEIGASGIQDMFDALF